jgi:hypothetical protein
VLERGGVRFVPHRADDLGPRVPPLDLRELGGRHVRREIDRRRSAGRVRRARHREAVIASRGRDDALRDLLCWRPEQPVHRAPCLERARDLETFELQHDVGRDWKRLLGRAEAHHRGATHVRRDSFACRLDIADRDHSTSPW